VTASIEHGLRCAAYADERRQVVTLSKAHRETSAGQELIKLLTELSADGNVSRDELGRLRSWLEIDRGVDFPALPFLYETIEQISSDGEITEDELDRLALAIERVLPKDIRLAAAAKRKEARDARFVAKREAQRQTQIAARAERRAARDAARAQVGILHETDFPVRGAMRSEERRQACDRLAEGDSVKLEREPDNAHDANAILVIGPDDCELGYVPREDACDIAPLLDAGAEAEATVRRLWETPDTGYVVPMVLVKVRQGNADVSAVTAIRSQRVIAIDPAAKRAADPKPATPQQPAVSQPRGGGCTSATACFLLILASILTALIRSL
jgi:hypothetical protein